MALEPVVISLRRPTSDKSWGFALQGGVDQGLPVFVHKVTRNGIAHKSGLEPGDVVIKICATPVTGMTHAQVKAEILRAGNDLDFMVKKLDVQKGLTRRNPGSGPNTNLLPKKYAEGNRDVLTTH
uniref:PDZ domain-containing protein n=1 Tax=Trichobilharzia regenti TaxID=157069 RepID=A0AA85JYX9_TRIRE|nr:unnamed protein product [Trichobilharzia regenti]